MEKEQSEIIKALQFAIQMEVDGKNFYHRAGEKSGNKLGKELFQYLAEAEDIHRKKFTEIYKALKRGQNWPDVEAPHNKAKELKSMFAEATKALGTKVKVAESEVEAIKTAMEIESKSYKFYHSRSEQYTLPVEKRFYQAVAAEEREHHFALLDASEYLADPVGDGSLKKNTGL